MAIAISNIKPTRPTKPKTTPDRALFCRKLIGVGVAELECLEMIVDVRVRVCCATGVTTRGEDVVEAEEDGVLDGVDEVGDEDELVEIVDLLRLLVLYKMARQKLAVISKWK